mgnify:CR=1 FL=1
MSSTVCRVVDAFALARAPTLLRINKLGIARALSRAHFCLNTLKNLEAYALRIFCHDATFYVWRSIMKTSYVFVDPRHIF